MGHFIQRALNLSEFRKVGSLGCVGTGVGGGEGMRSAEVVPDPQLMQSMRAVGYTLETAIAIEVA
jgi:hypothetical protein